MEHISADSRRTYITDDCRIITYEATQTCSAGIDAFGLGWLEGKLLSQTYIAALMLAETIKNKNDRVALHIEGSGAIGGIYAETDSLCRVRGYVKNHPLDFKKQVIRSISDVIGAGFMTVIKQIEGQDKPFESSVMLKTGLIPNDTAVFFKESEQRNTCIAMWVDFNTDKRLSSAKGLYIEALPGADDAALEKMQNASIKLSGSKITGTMDEMITESFGEFEPRLLDENPITFFCPCSKDRFLSFINGMPSKEKEALLAEDTLEVECQYCGKKYKIGKEEIK